MVLKEVSLLYVEMGDTLEATVGSKRSKFPFFFFNATFFGSSFCQSDIDKVILPNIDIIRYFGTSISMLAGSWSHFILSRPSSRLMSVMCDDV